MALRALLFVGMLGPVLSAQFVTADLRAQDAANGEPPFEVVGPSFFAVQVRDDSAAADWYRRAFGLAEVRHSEAADGRYSIRLLKRGGLTVELIRFGAAVEAADPRLGLFKSGFHVDDIDAAYAWLAELGTKLDQRISSDEVLGSRTFVLRDPEGNRLQIFSTADPAQSSAATPPAVYVDEGACPFECCSYGRWWAIGQVELRTQPRAGAPVTGSVQPGDTVMAETGVVRTVPAPFLVKQALDGYSPGDTIWLLTYLGEGFFKVWDGGEVRELELEFSPYGGSPGARCEHCEHGELLTPHESEWWVRITTAAGVSGWTRGTESFDGMDACG